MNALVFSNMSVWVAAASAACVWGLPKAHQRWMLSRAKHRSLAGHSKMAKKLARQLPAVSYSLDEFCACDDATAAVQARRKQALASLRERYAARYALTREATTALADSLPDLRFTGRYRVPMQFTDVMREHARMGAVMRASEDVYLDDLDGNRFIDLTGSYGVNVFGIDFYKATLEQAQQRAHALGPVLGSYHPAVPDVVQRLRALSGMDAVSFHMSGTEAVMQAVRVARYHTGRSHIVRFCGAYHGWWDDVQPGIGNPMPPREVYTLQEMSERTLSVLRSRRDIACVLVNPLQALHPNQNAPADSALLDSCRHAGFDRAAYTAWLKALRAVCSERGIVLIFDEVFLGFRLAKGGAQAYFDVRADLVTYGKTLGGGLPVGVVCGRADLMTRYRPERPADICFARGTFNAHPYVMCAMQVFLERLDEADITAYYEEADARWAARAGRFNAAMAGAGLPVRAVAMQSIWTLTYTQPSRFNWLYQFYVRLHGVALSWIGTGRLIFSLSFTQAHFDEVVTRFVEAGLEMQKAGWWLSSDATAVGLVDNKQIRRRVLRELIRARLG
jgi:glutamate-1-semialdehyde 2,1-aminomutase